MSFKILILGGGQLGSRYLQGLLKHHSALRIFVLDPWQQSLDLSAQRMREVKATGAEHRVSFHQTCSDIPADLDLSIVATTADVRPDAVRQIASRGQVRYWVLEKVLAQSEHGLQQLAASISGATHAWVNTPRRMMPWHREIKANLACPTPIEMSVAGGLWNMASNAIHFIDLLAWWTGESLLELSTELLEPKWRESKRKGFFEVSGTLIATFSGGSKMRLCSSHDLTGQPVTISVAGTDGATWTLRESSGFAQRSDGLLILGESTPQSILTTNLVDDILACGQCDLPSFDESLAMHRVLIASLQKHWAKTQIDARLPLPIT